MVVFAGKNQYEENKHDCYREHSKPCPAEGGFEWPPVVKMCPANELIPVVLERCFIRFSLSLIEQSVSEVEKPHKRCSGLFSVALSSELDAAIVTKCHGIKICQEFHREC